MPPVTGSVSAVAVDSACGTGRGGRWISKGMYLGGTWHIFEMDSVARCSGIVHFACSLCSCSGDGEHVELQMVPSLALEGHGPFESDDFHPLQEAWSSICGCLPSFLVSPILAFTKKVLIAAPFPSAAASILPILHFIPDLQPSKGTIAHVS
jgi:hypothetical protein